MNRRLQTTVRGLMLLSIISGGVALATDYDIDWYTIDGGGEMWTAGGDFELSGTIGQPDANAVVMTGGAFELAGGFWAGVPPFQVGDLNCDGAVNGFDIDPFVLALTDVDAYYVVYPGCDHMLADCNGDGEVNGFDIDPFVELLIGG